MLPFNQVIYKKIEQNHPGMLVGDIGGTNSNFGIAQRIEGNLELIFSMHIKSTLITNFTQTIVELVDYLEKNYGINIQNACFAAAGVVSPKQDMCKPTNLNITIDAKDIAQQSTLKHVFIINDFAVIGFGINRINPKDLVLVQHGNEFKHGNKAILGAGTGLGKAILRWVESKNHYFPVASEGGHADFAAQTIGDVELITFIQQHENHRSNVSWEDLLSGNGIERIFNFFGTTHQQTTHNNAPKPDEIFAHRYDDQRCEDTVNLYANVYARCAKNWALDALALGGIYIAGGIAAKNVDMFKLDHFIHEFSNCGKQEQLLKSIPIWVIADYNVSLHGAIEYMQLEGQCTL